MLNLIEPEFRNYINRSLHESYQYRCDCNTFAANFFLVAVLVAACAAFCIYKYKHRMTPEQHARVRREQFQKNVEAIKRVQMEKLRESQGMISGLPNWKNEFETIVMGNEFYSPISQPLAPLLPR